MSPAAGPVLLVEDEPNIRETLAFLLEMEGFAVVTAQDGHDALRRVRETEPRVMLLDAMLPGLDGFEVCRIVRSDPRFAATVVIMVTAMGQPADRERALAAGAHHFVTKPFDDEALIALIRQHVG